jgi:peptidylprolyl isomerase
MDNQTILNIVIGIFALFMLITSLKRRSAAKLNIASGEQFLADNATKEGVITTESGLQYVIISKSDNRDHPTNKSKLTVHYHGTLLNGTVFDSSVARDKPLTFTLNQVIKGWQEGLKLMAEGDKYRLFIPFHLAYGRGGNRSIPAGSMLIFDVELIKIHSITKS